MRAFGVAALGAACAILVVCPADRRDLAAADDTSATTPTAAEGESTGVRATVQRSRLFETRRGVRVNLANVGDEDVRVGSVQLDSPWFDPVDPELRDPVLRPDAGPVAMPLSFGRARCEGDTDGPTVVRLTVDGEEIAVEAEQSPPGLLAGLRDAECEVAAVREQVDLRLGARWERTGIRSVAGAIEVSQLEPGAEVAVVGVEGNVIFDLDLAAGPSAATPSDSDSSDTAPSDTDSSDASIEPDGPLIEIDDDRPTGLVGVVLTAARCDPHALIEYKRTFTFVALVDTGEGDPVRVDVTAEDGGEAHQALQASLTACIG